MGSPEWQAGHLAGADDCSNFLDWREEVRQGGSKRNRPRTEKNPHQRGTAEWADWGNGYEHGWHEARDEDAGRLYRAQQRGAL